jgi:Big-like domain-containing protein
MTGAAGAGLSSASGTGTSSDSLNHVVTKAATDTSQVSSNNPSNVNQNVTFTATVTHQGSAVTTGTVTFKEGATVLAGPTAVNGSGRASFSKSNLSSGNHSITAVYNGTTNYQSSSNTDTQRVRQ